MLKPESSRFKRASVEVYIRSLYAIYQSDYPPRDRDGMAVARKLILTIRLLSLIGQTLT